MHGYYPRLETAALWLMALWILGTAADSSMLPRLHACWLGIWSDRKSVNTARACLRAHTHMSRCTCLCTCLKPRVLSREMLIVWKQEQTVFAPFQMKLQVTGPYAVFFRNLIDCQHTSTHVERITIILVAFPLIRLPEICMWLRNWFVGVGRCGNFVKAVLEWSSSVKLSSASSFLAVGFSCSLRRIYLLKKSI